MNDFEYKSAKVLEKLTGCREIDSEINYKNRSENPDYNFTISVFVSSNDIYRAVIPYTAFGEAGGSVMITQPLSKEDIEFYEDSKFFIVCKVISDEYFNNVYEYAKQIGAMIIYDLDDNIHEISESNPVFSCYNKDTEEGLTKLKSLENIISKCDSVIYSTRELQNFYSELNKNSAILPNFLDLDKRYKDLEKIDIKSIAKKQGVKYTDESVIIGFFGSESHYDDMEILKNPICKLLSENSNIIFALNSSQPIALSLLIKNWNIPNNKFLFFPFKNHKDYLKYVSCFDIGLAPLQTTLFNSCKSNLKLLEYGALGIPYVASKVSNFQRFHVESKKIGGFICNASQDWYEKINFLVNNPKIRKKMGNELQQYVYKNYDVKQSLVLITNVLRTLYENKNLIKKKPTIFELADCYDNVPQVKFFYDETDVCPCGSGDKYINCKNECYPAWGEIVKEDICQSNN